MKLAEKVQALIVELQEYEPTFDRQGADIGDVGNAIGHKIGQHITPDDLYSFINGLEHGFSMATGTHCGIDSDCPDCKGQSGVEIGVQATWNGQEVWKVIKEGE